jgi:uncharacterized membrane protein YfcA
MATYAWITIAAFAAGVINAVAGGGTLLTFPALLSVLPSVVANGTSTVALVPGSLAGAWGYRQEVRASWRWIGLLLVPSVVGGALGTLLVTRLDERYFARMVPWLILTATLLFLIQPTLARLTGIGKPHVRPRTGMAAAIVLGQTLVALYGGYFGAGIGILMLGSLAVLGLADIHQMNGVKTVLAACINSASIAVFVADGKVVWSYAILMAGAAIAGGYFGAVSAKRLSPELVRWVVIIIGLTLSAYYFLNPPMTSPGLAPAARETVSRAVTAFGGKSGRLSAALTIAPWLKR